MGILQDLQEEIEIVEELILQLQDELGEIPNHPDLRHDLTEALQRHDKLVGQKFLLQLRKWDV